MHALQRIRRQQRSLNLKCLSGKKINCLQHTNVVDENSNLQQQSNEQNDGPPSSQSVSHRFIPMTRRTLCRKILEDGNLYASSEHLKFQDLITGIDTAISRGFYGTLGNIKQLYDPLNPDKETMVTTNLNKNERLDNEFWLLQNLSKLLEKAHFYELPPELIETALQEHPVFEGVLVSVDPKKYDVLRLWVLMEEVAPVEFASAAERMLYYSKVLMKKAPKMVPRYKRVVLAVRTKKQNKLMLKSFKDIPTNSLEYLLPEGKIRMSKFDKSFMAVTVFIGLTTGLIKIILQLADYNVQWIYIGGIITGMLALRAWNAYKNKRNHYLMNLSKLLYFKTVANNRALLALIVDRAQDETFKSALLSYSFIRANRRHVSDAGDLPCVESVSGMTSDELKNSVETWMSSKYKLDVVFDPQESLKQLEDIGLLRRNDQDGIEMLEVPNLEEALRKVPAPLVPARMQRDEEFDIEELKFKPNGNGDVDGDEMKINWK
eukprot:gene18900-20802_t